MSLVGLITQTVHGPRLQLKDLYVHHFTNDDTYQISDWDAHTVELSGDDMRLLWQWLSERFASDAR